MSRMKKSMLSTLMLVLGLSTAGQADWFHFANNVRLPSGNLVHDADMLQMSVAATEAASTYACVRYFRESTKAKKGKVKTTARYMLDGEEIASLSFTTGVTQDRVLNCKEGPEVTVGTVVEFEHEFLGMPRVLGKKGQFVDVSGVVGESMLDEAIAFDEGSLALTSADEESSGRIVGTSSLYVTDTDGQKHPKSLDHTLVTNRDMVAPMACIAYRRNAESKRSQGRVTATATVMYPDGETETLNFSSGVNQFEAVSCRELSQDAPVGTIIQNEISFINMPKVKGTEEAQENFIVNTSLSTAGDVDFRPPPVPAVADVPADTGGGGGAPPPGSTGALSAADQACISRVLYASGGGSRQIVRPRGNKGGKFEVFGPNSTVDSTGHPVVSTLGFGSTYAAACADYERKRGSLPAGPSLPAADIGLWVWYSNMNSANGPTAVRRDPRGGFHGDCWRAAKGVIIFNGNSPNAVLKLLQGAGL